MTKAEKLLEKIRNAPQAVRWEELIKFLNREGFKIQSGDGSRYTCFREADQKVFHVHKPHGKRKVDIAAVKKLLELLNLK